MSQREPNGMTKADSAYIAHLVRKVNIRQRNLVFVFTFQKYPKIHFKLI